jgi:hypothetical protein
MMWTSFFRDGGWGMYPTSIFGFLLIASAVLLVLRPERRFVALVVSLGVVTLGAGVLGTLVGIVNTFRYVTTLPAADQLKVTTLGAAESLNNLVLAIMLVVLASILAAVAALRATRTSAAASPKAA